MKHFGFAIVLGMALVALDAASGAAWAAPALPQAARLDPVRADLEALVAGAEREGLPVELLISKTREGLAKGASAATILSAVRSLERSLTKAARLLQASGRRTGGVSTSTALLRALAEGDAGGVELPLTEAMLRSKASDAELVRAVDALTELALRGYPRQRAAEVVQKVLVADPGAVGRVVAGLENLRTTGGLSRTDAVDSLGYNLAGTSSLETALTRSLDAASSSGSGDNGSRDRDRDRGNSDGRRNRGKN
jgi:hypothetical protein